MATSETKLTSEEVIKDRVKRGHEFVERGIADRDESHCKRFLDGSEAASLLFLEDDAEGVLPETQEDGNVNYLAINIKTKVAALAIGDPDFVVDCGEDPDPETAMLLQMAPEPVSAGEKAEIVREFLKGLWKAKRYARVCRKALTKRCISGMGFVAYLWNAERGPILEHVAARDVCADPNVSDWGELRWGGRRVRLPRDIAEKKYPKFAFLFPSVHDDIPDMDNPGRRTKDALEFWMYWDETTEAVVYGDTLIERGPNLYGRVPLLVLEGDIAPESEFSLGDYDCSIQLQTMLARLQALMNNQAENGGAIGWVDIGRLDDSSKEDFANGRPNKWVKFNGVSPDDLPMGYVSAQPMNAALLEAFGLAQSGLDSATGVTEYMRGVIQRDPKFATQAAMLANQSGSRSNQNRIEFEQFVDSCARAILDMMRQFGGTLADPESDEENLLLDAIESVQDVCVIESSTAYKDPAQEMQLHVQLLTQLMPFIQARLVNPIPLVTDMLRAFGKRDVNNYLVPASQALPMSPGGVPAPSGGSQQSPPAE